MIPRDSLPAGSLFLARGCFPQKEKQLGSSEDQNAAKPDTGSADQEIEGFIVKSMTTLQQAFIKMMPVFEANAIEIQDLAWFKDHGFVTYKSKCKDVSFFEWTEFKTMDDFKENLQSLADDLGNYLTRVRGSPAARHASPDEIDPTAVLHERLIAVLEHL